MDVRSALESVCSNPMGWPRARRRAFLIGLPVTLPIWLVAAAVSLLVLVIASVFVNATTFAQEAWADLRGD